MQQMIQQLFQSIDARDTAGFLAPLSNDVTFRFGNAPMVHGKAAVGAAVQGFFDSIQGLHHHLSAIWQQADALICHGDVTYTRHDGSTLQVPFANIFTLRDGAICEYLIFADTSALY